MPEPTQQPPQGGRVVGHYVDDHGVRQPVFADPGAPQLPQPSPQAQMPQAQMPQAPQPFAGEGHRLDE